MKEPYVEGAAIHDDPESCGATREGGGEALTGALASWVWSRERLKLQGVDAVKKRAEGHTARTVVARRAPALRGPRPHARGDTIHTGTGRSMGRPA